MATQPSRKTQPKRPETLRLYDQMQVILQAFQPLAMTLRQLFYQLVSRQIVENTPASYKSVGRVLLSARRDGVIPWHWIEDRTRASVGGGHGFSGPSHYLDYLRRRAGWGYSHDIWNTQPDYLEVWVEKDALSGIFSDALGDYDIALNIGKGYTSGSELYRVSQRLKREANRTGWPPIIQYYGDFDPSGEQMVEDLPRRLRDDFYWAVDVRKMALTHEQVITYNLPPDFTKATDSRAAKHIARYGDIAVELDALRPDVLRQMIADGVESVLDMDALARLRKLEQREGAALRAALIAAYDGIDVDALARAVAADDDDDE